MSTLGKAEVAWNGLLPSLARLVRQWKPGELQKEIHYRNSLVSFLRASVPPDCRVEREYRHAGTTADACVLWKGILSSEEVFIEIKAHMRKKPVYDRLVGQIEALNPTTRMIMVVIVGDSDEGLVGRLREKYPVDDDLDDFNVAVVHVT